MCEAKAEEFASKHDSADRGSIKAEAFAFGQHSRTLHRHIWGPFELSWHSICGP